jgi:hypothetical protein
MAPKKRREPGGGNRDVAPIAGKGADARLTAILRRHRAERPAADGSYRLPEPPRPRREDLKGQPELFG